MRIHHTLCTLLNLGDSQALDLENRYDAKTGASSLASDLMCGRAEVYAFPTRSGVVAAYTGRESGHPVTVAFPSK